MSAAACSRGSRMYQASGSGRAFRFSGFNCCGARNNIVHPVPTKRLTIARGWGDDVVFTEAQLTESRKDAKDMHIVTVDVGADIASGYTKGGQFLQMKVGDSKPAFLAIANSPDSCKEGKMEFLIKDLPESTANLIINLKSGDTVMVSPVMGKGFPVDTVPSSDYSTMLVFATGSGISPIKALIDSGALDSSSRSDVRVYYGATDADSMAYLDKIPVWESTGLKVIKVFSARGEGYVQDVYAKDTPVSEPSKTCVLLCGQKEMAESVKEILGKQGVETFLTNF